MGARQRPQGQRPRPHLGRGPGRLRQGALTAIPVAELAARLAGVLTSPSVRAAGPGDADLPWRWADVVEAQGRGQDPTGPWRDALAASTSRQYGIPVPAATPAAFVLQWLLEVAAVPAAFAARHTEFVVRPLEAGLSFAVDPRFHHPVEVSLRRVSATPALLGDRLDLARAAYREAATALAETYRPGVNLGRHQRLSMVDDVWAMADARARGAGPPDRASCCFIYALPGAHECAGCPRSRDLQGNRNG